MSINLNSSLVRDWESAASVPAGLGVRNVYLRSGVVLGREGGMIKQIYPSFFFGLGGRMGYNHTPA